jgi:5-(aminomethyl)-3-furanmethanol phosphate kinase
LSLTVIKLGGSLMRSRELPAWLKNIESISVNSNIVIVPGGGEFANSVRSLQMFHGFDDSIAHRMALLAMCQYGYLLAGMNSKLMVVEDIESISASLNEKKPFIWLPTVLIDDHSEVPANWDFTSDSIALWLATKLSATNLILVKSKNLNSAKVSIREHIKLNHIDKGFQELTGYYSGKILFMDKSEYINLI